MKRLMSALTTAVLLGASFAQVTPEEVDAALEASALGPHQPQEEDWNEIERLARAAPTPTRWSIGLSSHCSY